MSRQTRRATATITTYIRVSPPTTSIPAFGRGDFDVRHGFPTIEWRDDEKRKNKLYCIRSILFECVQKFEIGQSIKSIQAFCDGVERAKFQMAITTNLLSYNLSIFYNQTERSLLMISKVPDPQVKN